MKAMMEVALPAEIRAQKAAQAALRAHTLTGAARPPARFPPVADRRDDPGKTARGASPRRGIPGRARKTPARIPAVRRRWRHSGWQRRCAARGCASCRANERSLVTCRALPERGATGILRFGQADSARARAQGSYLGGRAVQLGDHLAVALPRLAQFLDLARRQPFEAALGALVLRLRALVPAFEALETVPKPWIEPFG